MNQNSNGDCCCNDYANYSANIGIAQISSGNNLLTGVGSIVVITGGAAAGSNGTLIKTIRIKASGQVNTGMIRLFVLNSGTYMLYKEIPVPTTPALAASPTPPLIMETFEVEVRSNLKLSSGWQITATTQNSEPFNIVAEGLDWYYQSHLPPGCCSFKQENAIQGLGNPDFNTALDGSTPIATIFTASIASASKGSLIKSVTLKALQNTNLGMVRFFLQDQASAGPWVLIKEVCIPETVQSGFEPSFKAVVDLNLNVPAGYLLGATTQVQQSFAVTVDGIWWTYPTYP